MTSALRPSRLQLPALLAMIPAAGAALADAGASARDDREDGRRFMRASGSERPRCAASRPKHRKARSSSRRSGSTWKTARSASLRSKGLDTRTPKGPVKLGRFALKSLDIANFMRMSAQFANPAQKPSPEQIAGLFPLHRGRRGQGRRRRPSRTPASPVNLDSFNLNWGQFVGPIPSKARLTAKMTTPVDASRSCR